MVLHGVVCFKMHGMCSSSSHWHDVSVAQLALHGMVWYSMVVYGVAQGVFHGMAIYGMIWDGTAQVAETQVWYGMTCAQLALHVMPRYGVP